MKKYNLEIIVLFSGAVVMILELVGSRILAPTLGTSLFIWTSLIGVILGSLSIGYWQGGKLADRNPNYKILFGILVISSILIGAIGICHEQILEVTQKIFSDLRFNSFASALILFALPNIFLGMVSPYAAKLKLIDLKASGQTVGNLYALSTVGSILGTFSAGFWLIPFFGITKILIGLAFGTFALALIIVPKLNLKTNLFLSLTLILLFSSLVVCQKQKNNLIETYYSTVKIFEAKDQSTLRPVRILATGPRGAQSAIFIDNDLVATYTKFYRLADYFNPGPQNTLMIGGGAFTYPRDFLARHPESKIDVVEIDPMMTKIAKKYFNFQEDSRLKITNEDGRLFLNQNKKQYNTILIDAFNSLTPPYNLTTIESVKEMNQSLDDHGIVIVNMVSALTGDNGKFAQAEYKTFSQVFPQVFVFLPTGLVPNPTGLQNIMLVATKTNQKYSFHSDDINQNILLRSLWQEKIPDAPVLTDNLAPVEYYLRNI